MCTVCPVNRQLSNQYFIKFGWQIGGGAGEQRWRRRVEVEQESSGGGGEWRWSRRAAVEQESGGGAGEQRWSRRVEVEQESSGGGGEQRWRRRAAVEEERRVVGEREEAEERKLHHAVAIHISDIITSFWPLRLGMLWNGTCLCCLLNSWEKGACTVTCYLKPKTIVISLGPFEYLWLFEKYI